MKMRVENITIISGDITIANVDVIVNAAKSVLTGGSGVDGAIHAAAGPMLLSECLKIALVNGMRCAPGQAKLTGSGNLLSRYVIHTVGPKYTEDLAPEKLLAMSYRNSLDLALKHNCKSIAFPAISCGNYGYPIAEAAKIAVQSCMKYSSKNIEIYFYLLGKNMNSAFEKELSYFRDKNC